MLKLRDFTLLSKQTKLDLGVVESRHCLVCFGTKQLLDSEK